MDIATQLSGYPQSPNIQQGLVNADIMIDLDGIFGPGTERAIIAFQTQQGLVINGTVGPPR
jgi:peptidoglycan hydrolase-like protein with peptidoglycan-binding domain